MPEEKTAPSENLPRGHQAKIAQNLNVSKAAVSLTLRGRSKSLRILREHARLVKSYAASGGQQ